MTGWRLVSDVGGTNVRFARGHADGRIEDMRSVPLQGADSFCGALTAYISQTGGAEGCTSAAIGAAGPVENNRVALTNADWVLDGKDISIALGGAPVRLVNDLEAAAIALPFLGSGDIEAFGDAPGQQAHTGAKLAVNVGTGFGAATVFAGPDGSYLTRPSEAGHMTLAATNEAERSAFAGCHSIEDVLSGHGLADLHARLCAGTEEAPAHDAAEVLQRCDQEAAAAGALGVFTYLLGRVCGDLVLAGAAWGGVYLFGSVVTGWRTAANPARFRRTFEGQSAMRDRLQGVPTRIVTRTDAPLLGLARLRVGA